ncbi:MAG: hypothetical protein HY512_03355 [Candidatus Aenigmarchaeota archaeon]|nr:hypothetical protein [Candidatus Aenigmarchaeota archaeon]
MADFIAVYGFRELAFLTDNRSDPPIGYRRVGQDPSCNGNFVSDQKIPLKNEWDWWGGFNAEDLPEGPVKDLLSGDKPGVVSRRYGVEVAVRRH